MTAPYSVGFDVLAQLTTGRTGRVRKPSLSCGSLLSGGNNSYQAVTTAFRVIAAEETIMKQATILLSLIASLVALADARGQLSQAKPTISISGTAEVCVVPDEVNLRLGVETRDPTLDEAVKQNETHTTAVLKFLKDSGIESKDVQTDFIEIHPQYNSDRKEQQIIPQFYLVKRNLGVRLRKVSLFDYVLAGGLRTGVNIVDGVEFRTTELRKHRDAARQQAIRAAKEKAVGLATELDAKVGKPENIQEQTHGGMWSWSGLNWRNINPMAQSTVQVSSGGESSEGNLAVGMISVTATVNVTFLLE
jgi:uncharacterized protein YggE